MKSIKINLNQEVLLVIENGLLKDSDGGIYNSSFFKVDNSKYLISRVEKNNELDRKLKHTEHRPVLFKIDDTYNVKSAKNLQFIYDGDLNELTKEHNLDGFQKYRIEDFRVFSWNNQLWCNHNFSVHKVRPVISRINIEKSTLEHKKIKVKYLLNRVEKNWLFFEHENKIKFIYSINPLRIFSSEDGYEFKRELKIKTNLDKKYFWSGSTNPVDFDENHLMFFAHYRDEKKVYCNHLILLCKKTLEPILISENPIFREDKNKGIKPNVLYLMSHTKVNSEDWIFSFGEGDMNTRIIKIKHKNFLEQLFEND